MHLEGQVAPRSSAGNRGFAMAALLVAIAVLSVVMLVALPTWRQQAQREKEAELIFRGEQYARAIRLYQRKIAGAFPPSLDVLVEQKFIRKKYKDPITGDDFVPVYASAQAGGQSDAQPPGPFALLRGLQRAGEPAAGQPSAPSAPSAPAGPGGVGASPRPGGQTSTSPFGQSTPGGAPVPGATGIVGVTSRSTAQSIRLYNGRNRYDQWIFLYSAAPTTPGSILLDQGGVAGQPQPPGQLQRPSQPQTPGGNQ